MSIAKFTTTTCYYCSLRTFFRLIPDTSVSLYVKSRRDSDLCGHVNLVNGWKTVDEYEDNGPQILVMEW